ncbi:hypothetical protein QYF36_014023 [Acer negundo]|nr:hypothetical protein QYF36_014023 [Acer negundo]
MCFGAPFQRLFNFRTGHALVLHFRDFLIFAQAMLWCSILEPFLIFTLGVLQCSISKAFNFRTGLGGHWPLEIQLLPSRSLFFAQSVQSRGQLTQGQSARRQSTIRDSIAHILEFLLFAQSMQSRGSLAILNCSHRGVFVFCTIGAVSGAIGHQRLNCSHRGVFIFCIIDAVSGAIGPIAPNKESYFLTLGMLSRGY